MTSLYILLMSAETATLYFLNLIKMWSRLGCSVGPVARISLREVPVDVGQLPSKTTLSLVVLEDDLYTACIGRWKVLATGVQSSLGLDAQE